MAGKAAPGSRLDRAALEQFREKCAAAFRLELRENNAPPKPGTKHLIRGVKGVFGSCLRSAGFVFLLLLISMPLDGEEHARA